MDIKITSIENGNVNYEYALNGAKTHAKPDNDENVMQNIDISVTTKAGTTDGNVSVTVVDDAPQITSEDDITGTMGHFGFEAGADGLAKVTANGVEGKVQEDGSITFDLACGKLTLTENGNGYDWNYSLDPNGAYAGIDGSYNNCGFASMVLNDNHQATYVTQPTGYIPSITSI